MHRRLGDLTASRAEALLGDGADLVAEDVARAAEPAFGGAHFDVKRNPALRSREWKHHYEARSASIEAIGRNDHRRADEILLMTPGRAEIDRPDFTAQRTAGQLTLPQAVSERVLPRVEITILFRSGAAIRDVRSLE